MRRDETPGQIVTNLCTGVGVHDVITCADLYYDRLRCVGVAGGQILGFSIDLLRRPYNTLALPCECVIMCHLVCRGILGLLCLPDHVIGRHYVLQSLFIYLFFLKRRSQRHYIVLLSNLYRIFTLWCDLIMLFYIR